MAAAVCQQSKCTDNFKFSIQAGWFFPEKNTVLNGALPYQYQ